MCIYQRKDREKTKEMFKEELAGGEAMEPRSPSVISQFWCPLWPQVLDKISDLKLIPLLCQ